MPVYHQKGLVLSASPARAQAEREPDDFLTALILCGFAP